VIFCTDYIKIVRPADAKHHTFNCAIISYLPAYLWLFAAVTDKQVDRRITAWTAGCVSLLHVHERRPTVKTTKKGRKNNSNGEMQKSQSRYITHNRSPRGENLPKFSTSSRLANFIVCAKLFCTKYVSTVYQKFKIGTACREDLECYI